MPASLSYVTNTVTVSFRASSADSQSSHIDYSVETRRNRVWYTPHMSSKPFSLQDRIDEVKTAERFAVDVTDVRGAIKAIIQEKGDVTISVTKRKGQLTEYIRHVYDQAAKSWEFADMAHMLATYHTEVIARGIANPDRFARDATRVGSDVARIVYPKETASITRRLPPGESKEEILERLVARLSATVPPPSPAASDEPHTRKQMSSSPETDVPSKSSADIESTEGLPSEPPDEDEISGL